MTNQYKYQAAVFSITTKTNLHVGSGSQNFGVIDNLIQRDQLTGFPCIYSSSLKGALREYIRHYLNKGGKEKEDFLLHIFGFEKCDTIEDDEVEENNDNQENEDKELFNSAQGTLSDTFNVKEDIQENKDKEQKIKKTKQQAGKYRFLQADLLSIPIRSDKKLFYRTTSPFMLINMQNNMDLYKLQLKDEYEKAISILETLFSENKVIHFDTNDTNETVILEINNICSSSARQAVNYSNVKILENIFGKDMAIVNDIDFAELVSDYNLPVIARNNLVDGNSTNLWYEQIIPAETRFLFTVLYPSGDTYFENFAKVLQENPVQIGANASIGYGFCKIEQVDWFNN